MVNVALAFIITITIGTPIVKMYSKWNNEMREEQKNARHETARPH